MDINTFYNNKADIMLIVLIEYLNTGIKVKHNSKPVILGDKIYFVDLLISKYYLFIPNYGKKLILETGSIWFVDLN